MRKYIIFLLALAFSSQLSLPLYAQSLPESQEETVIMTRAEWDRFKQNLQTLQTLNEQRQKSLEIVNQSLIQSKKETQEKTIKIAGISFAIGFGFGAVGGLVLGFNTK